MGAKLFSKCSDTSTSPNPNKFNFKIKKIVQWGEYCVCLVNYPDCTTYNGDKVMVYLDDKDNIKKRAELDPHFLENGLSPKARFPGNEEGWNNAVDFVMGKMHFLELSYLD